MLVHVKVQMYIGIHVYMYINSKFLHKIVLRVRALIALLRVQGLLRCTIRTLVLIAMDSVVVTSCDLGLSFSPSAHV